MACYVFSIVSNMILYEFDLLPYERQLIAIVERPRLPAGLFHAHPSGSFTQ